MLDRVDSGVGGNARRLIRRRVCGDAFADAMRFLDDHAHLLERDDARPGVDDDLDDVGAVVERLTNCASRVLDAADDDVLLFDQLLRFRGETAELSARGRQRARRRDDVRAFDPPGVDRVAQRDVAIPSRIPEVAHGR